MTNVIQFDYDSFTLGTTGEDTLVLDMDFGDIDVSGLIINDNITSFTFDATRPGRISSSHYQVAEIEYFQFNDQTLTFREIVRLYKAEYALTHGTKNDDVYTGTDGDDLFSGLRGDDDLSGGDGDDRLYGGYGDDTLEGGAGDDDIAGSDGIDTAVINDTFENSVLLFDETSQAGTQYKFGTSGEITLRTADGTDTYRGIEYFEFSDKTVSVWELVSTLELYDDAVIGTSGDDVIHGSDTPADPYYPETEIISAGDGDDTFHPGTSSVYYDGGDGIDTVVIDAPSTSYFDTTPSGGNSIKLVYTPPGYDFYEYTISLGIFTNVEYFQFTDKTLTLAELYDLLGGKFVRLSDPSGERYVGYEGIEEVFGGNGDDKIFGLGGDDDLRGWSGDDIINGGAGDDYLKGDDGADEISGGQGADLVNGGHGNDHITGGTGNDRLLGQIGNDDIYGDAGRDDVDGGDGHDTVRGGQGADEVYGGNGNDTLFGGHGNDHLEGGTGNDRMAGGAGSDTLLGGDGQDTMKGGDGHDTMNGADGSDTIYGGNGKDTIEGEDGHDTIYGGAGSDWIDGDEGSDTIYGDSGADQIYGGTGADSIYGGAGDDRLSGSHGRDTINGGAGTDTIILGTDTHVDTVVLSKTTDSQANEFADLVYDFDATKDVFDFTEIDAQTGVPDHQDFDYSSLNSGGVANGVWVDYYDYYSTIAAIVSGDVDGDGRADFSIVVFDVTDPITVDNFVF